MISNLVIAEMIEFIIRILMEVFENIAGGGGDIYIVSNSN